MRCYRILIMIWKQFSILANIVGDFFQKQNCLGCNVTLACSFCFVADPITLAKPICTDSKGIIRK